MEKHPVPRKRATKMTTTAIGTRLVYLCRYNAAPADDAFRRLTAADLEERFPHLHAAHGEADWNNNGRDLETARRLLDSGFPILAAFDEDGIYLGVELHFPALPEEEWSSRSIVLGSFPLAPKSAWQDEGDWADATADYEACIREAVLSYLSEDLGNDTSAMEVRLNEGAPGEIRVYF